jgi:MoaA/NifB/PqqE/SkfB family radical SAM enzyme
MEQARELVIFDKIFRNENYELFFNTMSGFEILRGVNGKEDPFWLELPSLLDIGIMGTCYHNCPFCYQGHIKEPNMTFENYKWIINQVKHHTNQVALGGRGDPNKHKDFRKIVEYSRNSGVVPNYTTSGIDLTDEEVETSKLCGAIAVSDYEKPFTYQALKMFMDAGIKTNIHQIFSSGTFTKSMKIIYGYSPWQSQKREKVDTERLNAVVFLLFKPQGEGKNIPAFIPSEYQLKTFSEMVLKGKAKFKIGMDSCLVNHLIRYATPTDGQMMSLDTCEGARMSAYISPDLKMMPCSFSRKSSGVQLSNKKSISNVWENSRIFKSFRSKLKRKPDKCPINFEV